MRTDELILSVREQALEFDHDPITDEGILRRINFAYAFAYNHFAKSDEALFGKYFYFSLKSALSEYDIPKDLWGKRIKTLECPTPPQQGYEPFNYVGIERVDPQSFPKYDSPRARTLPPLVWTQLGNKIRIAPPPLVASKVRVLGIPAPTPLGLCEGLIQDFQGDLLTLDRAPTDTLSKNINSLGQNLLSICDGQTGELKAIYPYTEVNGVTVRLGDATTKTVLRSKPIRKLYTHYVAQMTYDAVNKTVSVITTNPVTDVAIGDYIEISYLLDSGVGYNIDGTTATDSDFYDPPEFTAPVDSFTRGGVVTAVGLNSITWRDDTAVPPLVNGYQNPTGVGLNGTVTNRANAVYLGNPVQLITCGAAHGLTVGQVYKINIAGTGTDLNGVKKIVVLNATQFYVLQAVVVGVFVAGTWSLYQYAVGLTGWPQLKEVAFGTPTTFTALICINSPYTYSLRPERSNNDPEAYDVRDNILLDDVVSWGYGTAIPIIPEAYHEVLVQYCVLTMKSSLNETDNEVAALLKEMLTSMKGDTAGRKLGVRIQRDFSSRSNYLTASRKYGRR